MIQKARSNRRWKNTPLARAVGSTSNARFRDRYKAARKAWKRDRQDYNYAGNQVEGRPASTFVNVVGSASED